MSRSRKASIAQARQEVFYRLRELDQPPSLPQIGQWMGLDHTTVLHGLRAHARRRAEVSAWMAEPAHVYQCGSL